MLCFSYKYSSITTFKTIVSQLLNNIEYRKDLYMKPKVLLFNFNDRERSIKTTAALMPLGLRIIKIKKEDYLQPIGYLAGKEDIEPRDEIYTGEELDDEMLVMVNLSGKQIDGLIMGLKKTGVGRINYKAVLTETNQHWTTRELYDELKEEHEMIKNQPVRKKIESVHEQ